MNIWQWVNGWNRFNVMGITNDFAIFPLKQTLTQIWRSARSALKGCLLNVRGLNCVYVTVFAYKVVFVPNTCLYLVMLEQELLTLQESCPLLKCQLCRQHLRVKQH